MITERQMNVAQETKRLLEIKGDKRNSNSIFDRLGISPNLDFERIMEYEFDDEEFANNIPSLSAFVTPDGFISSSTNPLDLLLRTDIINKT